MVNTFYSYDNCHFTEKCQLFNVEMSSYGLIEDFANQSPDVPFPHMGHMKGFCILESDFLVHFYVLLQSDGRRANFITKTDISTLQVGQEGHPYSQLIFM